MPVGAWRPELADEAGCEENSRRSRLEQGLEDNKESSRQRWKRKERV